MKKIGQNLTLNNLTHTQVNLWLEWKLDPYNSAYNNPLLYKINGAVDPDIMQKALKKTVDSFQALHFVVDEVAGLPQASWRDQVDVTMIFQDFSTEAHEHAEIFTQKCLQDSASQPFDLSTGPLFRFILVRESENKYWFLANIHHIAVDGVSADIIMNRISTTYALLSAQKTPYSEPVVCDAEAYTRFILETEANNIDNETDYLTYWQSQLAEVQATVDFAKPLVEIDESDPKRIELSILDAHTSLKLKKQARNQGTSLFIFLLAAYYKSLSQFVNQYDITVNYPHNYRTQEHKELFGCFISYLSVRINGTSETKISNVIQIISEHRKQLKRLNLSKLAAFKSTYLKGRAPLKSNVSFTKANFVSEGLVINGAQTNIQDIFSGSSIDDLALFYDDSSECLRIKLAYNPKALDPNLAQNFYDYFLSYIKALANQNALLIDETLPNSADYQESIVAGPCLNIKTNLIQKIAEYAYFQPNKLAVKGLSDSYSYAQLYNQAGRYAQRLRKLSLNKPLIVRMQRKPDLVALLLGCQWAGVTYIPLDLATPAQRVAVVAEDSGSEYILSEKDSLIEDLRALRTISLLEPFSDLSKDPVDNFESDYFSEHSISYIIYTSGSTGIPKGVEIARSSLTNFLASSEKLMGFNEQDHWLAITTIGFDISAMELYLPLWCGGSLTIVDDEAHKDPFALRALLDTSSDVSIMQATPAMWQMLLDAGWKGNQRLKVLSGGEPLPQALADELQQCVFEVWNMYGPTEATIWCTLSKIKADRPITIGTPFHNTQLAIIDAHGCILPLGAKGELAISGPQLAKGYLNRDDLNKKQFSPLFGTQQRFYRTGDVACLMFDGEMHIYGRADKQIKLNGYRIELGEIESCLRAIEGISQAAVLLHQKRLIGCICPIEKNSIEEGVVLEHLRSVLPPYMLPSQIMVFDKIPLNSSGKLDRKVLLKKLPSAAIQAADALNFHDRYEIAIASVFKNVLGQSTVSSDTLIFAYGGNSLIATRILALVNKKFGCNIGLADFMKQPTVRYLAQIIKSVDVEVSGKKSKDIICSERSHWPLSYAQEQIVFLHRYGQIQDEYNMAAVVRCSDMVKLQQLSAAWHHVMIKHPLLMARLNDSEGTLSQYFHPTTRAEVVDSITFARSQSHFRTLSTLQSWAAQRFDIFDAALWRLSIQQIESENTCLIGVCVHHVIADGISVPMILKELVSALNGSLEEQVIDPITEIDYFTYAFEDRNQKFGIREQEYWQHQLSHCPYLHYPTCGSMQTQLEAVSRKAKQQTQVLETDQWHQIMTFCKRHSLSNTSFIVGAISLALADFCQQSRFCIGLPTSIRSQSRYMQTVGCFLNLLPIKIDLEGQSNQINYLQAIHQQLAEAISHQLPFSQLLKLLGIAPDLKQMPLFNTIVNIQENHNACVVELQEKIEFEPIHASHSLYDIAIDVIFNDIEANISISYQFVKLADAQVTELLQNIMRWIQILLDANCVQFPQYKLEQLEGLGIKVEQRHAQKTLRTGTHFKAENLWKSVLKIEEFNLDDNFFHLGGESLRVAKLIRAAEEQFGVLVSLPQFLSEPTFSKFCELIEQVSETDTQSIHEKTVKLTPNQRTLALYYGHAVANHCQSGSMYHLALLITNVTRLERNKLQDVVGAVIKKHPMYQAIVSYSSDQFDFVQGFNLNIQEHYFESKAHMQDYAKEFSAQPFDLRAAPLMRFALLYDNQGQCNFLVVCHHLITDEWSLQLLIQEILDTYQSTPDEINSTSFIRHEIELYNLSFQTKVESTAFWEDYWQSWQPSRLPETQCLNWNEHSYKGELEIPIDHDIYQKLYSLSRDHDVSIPHVIMTFFLINVAHFCGSETANIMTTYDRRTDSTTQQWHGYLVNLIPIGTQLDSDSTLADLLSSVKHALVESIEHSSVDFSQLLADHIAPDVGVLFSFQHKHDIHYRQQSLRWSKVENDWAKYPLTFIAREHEDGIGIIVEFDKRLYETAYIDLFIQAFEYLLNSSEQYLQKPYAQWKYCDEPITLCNPDAQLCEPSESLIDAIFHPSIQCHNRLALHFGELRYSYRELLSAVIQLQKRIKQLVEGCIERKRVIVSLRNGPEFVACILAVMGLGGWFVPIRADEVTTRKNFIVSDTDAVLVLAQSSNCRDFQVAHQLPVDNVDDLGLFSTSIKSSEISEPLISIYEHSGYVIYTSGTTGKSKGVLNDASGLHRTILGIQQKVGVKSDDIGLQFSSISFDACIYEIFTILSSQGTLVIPVKREFGLGEKLEQLIQKHNITFILLTPSVLNTIEPNSVPSLRIVQSGGESCTSTLVNKWSNKVKFFNAYGPSETAICCAINHMTESSIANCVGTPIGKAELSVVNRSGTPLPEGAIGELLISGGSVGLGYVNRPDLTARQFKFTQENNHYLSGDRARIYDGQVQCYGRHDRQIKLNGLRIELDEIEQVSQELSGVEIAICHVWQQKLVLHYRTNTNTTETDINAHLRRHLNAYMLPTIYILHETELPLTSSGKVDIKSLESCCEQSISVQQLQVDSLDGEIEQQIRILWQNTLNVDIPRFSDLDFFRLGGNSIHMIQVCSAINQKLGLEFSPEMFFSHSTINQQSQYISQLIEQGNSPSLGSIINKIMFFDSAQLTDLQKILKNQIDL